MLQNKNLYNITLYLINITGLSVFLYIVLTYNLTGDDFFYLYEAKSKPLLQAISDSFLTWNTRYTGMSLLLSVFKLYPVIPISFWFSIMYLLFFSTVFLWINKVLSSNLSTKILLSNSLILSLIFCLPGSNESFFWLTVLFMYFAGLVLSLAVLYFLFYLPLNTKTIAAYILLLILLSGTSEIISITILIICLVNGYFNNHLFKKPLYLKYWLLFIVLSIGVAILYFGQGTQNRLVVLNNIPDTPYTALVYYSIKSIVMALYKNLFAIIIFINFWLIFFSKINFNFKKHQINTLVIIALTISIVYVFIFPIFLKTVLPLRSYIIVFSIWGLVFLHRIYLLSQKIKNIPKFIYLSYWILIICFFCTTFYSEYTYNQSIKKRMINIHKHKNKHLLIVKPINAPSYSHHAKLSTDTMHYNNQHLKKGLQLNFAVSLKQKQAKN